MAQSSIPNQEPVRTPIGVASIRDSRIPLVVCDDGSVWRFAGEASEWVEVMPIPGTRRAQEPHVGKQSEGPTFRAL